MPELPEVEIIRQSLQKVIVFNKIDDVLVRNRSLRYIVEQNFERFLKKKKILKISRKSKYLIFHLDNKSFCILHLGMTGTLHLIENKKKKLNSNLSFYGYKSLPNKHNHIELIFSNFKIVYNDPRRFGYFKIINSYEELCGFFERIGPEPLEKNFNSNYLKRIIEKKKKNIKNLILDQKIISGIGNIYANEILFYAKINPLKKSKKINNNEINKIVKFAKFVIKKAIIKGGSSIRDFKNIKGNQGSFQKEFKVYNRENKKCLTKECKGKIKRIIISNRSTFICKFCQK